MRKPFFSRKAVAILSVALLAASLYPLFHIALYNHPFYDDLGYSLLTHPAWRETGSVFSVVAAAWRNTVGIRQTWQGWYTAAFISAMQPGVFGEGLYPAATFLLLGAFLLALGFFLWQIIGKLFRAGRPSFWICFSGLAFLMVQFVPNAAEAFFWFNSGAIYTLMYALSLVAAGLWIRLSLCGKRTTLSSMEGQ